jgi:hypothetical protein
MNPDGLSYLDLASAASSGGPAKLLNGYWSPGYPALLGIAIFLFRPTPAQEFPLIHLVNFLIFVAGLWAFTVFLRYWLKTIDQSRYLTPFAFCIFLWFTLKFIGVQVVTPDLCVAAIVFLAAGISCRLSLPEPRWRHYLSLGVVLGVGYNFKAPVLPLGLTLLLLLYFLLPAAGHTTRQLSLALVVLLAVAAPLIAALSVHAHRLSFGEAGRLNYAWYANGLRWNAGHEPPIPHSIPEHPAPKLLTTPVTLVFASPISGTYPLWYEPSYWYSGTNVRFLWGQQVTAIKETLRTYKGMAFDSLPFLSGAIVLAVLSLQEKQRSAAPQTLSWQIAWPLAACAMYALVHVESRFLGAFLVLFWLAMYTALMSWTDLRVAMAVSATVLCAVMILFLNDLAKDSAGIAKDSVHPRMPEYQSAGLGLRDLGLKSGDYLAVIGLANDCYYARYDRLRIVAQIPDAREFRHLSAPQLQLVEQRLASIGVKAVVASDRPDTSQFADWKDVRVSDSLRLSVLLLSPEVPATRR